MSEGDHMNLGVWGGGGGGMDLITRMGAGVVYMTLEGGSYNSAESRHEAK